MDSSPSLVVPVHPPVPSELAAIAPERLARRLFALGALLVLLATAFNVFFALGRTRIDDMDEARFGVAAYEMLQSRSFIVTTYAGQPETWNLKPPLGYWVLAVSFALLGPSALALRLPSALCTLGTVALLLLFCRRHLERRTAVLAAALLATCFGFFSHHGARSGDLDAALTLLLTLAATLLPDLAASGWRWLALWGIFTTGFLLKSFAIVPMMVVVGLFLLWTGDWRRLHGRACAAGALLFALATGGWAAARWVADGSPYFLRLLVTDEVVARCLHQVDRGAASWRIGYLPALFDRFAPWSELLVVAILVAGLAGGWRRLAVTLGIGSPRTGALLVLWAGVPLLVFSLAKTHHHWYLDPIYPPLAILGARSALWLVERTPRRWRAACAAALVVVPLLCCEARVVTRIVGRDRLPASQAFLLSLKDRRAELGPTLRVVGPLAHSERFILEAIDGYRLVDDAPAAPPADASPPAATRVALLPSIPRGDAL